MVGDTIKALRMKADFSQSELARRLDVTRASVNAWEMGLSTPTAQYIVALAKLFHVSADYLLGVEADHKLSLNGYTPEEFALVYDLVQYIDKSKNHERSS